MRPAEVTVLHADGGHLREDALAALAGFSQESPLMGCPRSSWSTAAPILAAFFAGGVALFSPSTPSGFLRNRESGWARMAPGGIPPTVELNERERLCPSPNRLPGGARGRRHTGGPPGQQGGAAMKGTRWMLRVAAIAALGPPGVGLGDIDRMLAR